jgi:hypothetical protein
MWFVTIMRATSRIGVSDEHMTTPGRIASETRACRSEGRR